MCSSVDRAKARSSSGKMQQEQQEQEEEEEEEEEEVEGDDEWHGWRSAVDELSGATYYYNVRLGRSSWDWPPPGGLV